MHDITKKKNMLHVSDRYLLHAVQSHLPCKHLCQLTLELCTIFLCWK